MDSLVFVVLDKTHRRRKVDAYTYTSTYVYTCIHVYLSNLYSFNMIYYTVDTMHTSSLSKQHEQQGTLVQTWPPVSLIPAKRVNTLSCVN